MDSIAVSAQVINSLQQIISRQINPLSPAVLTIGKITGGHARNVIADSVTLEGTVRTLQRETRGIIRERMEAIGKGVCEGMGASFQLEWIDGYPALVNSSRHIPLLERAASDIFNEHTLSIVGPVMSAEDFSFYAEKVPSLFFRLGVRNEKKGIVHQNHHPMFDLDEDALPIGAIMLARLAFNYLESGDTTLERKEL